MMGLMGARNTSGFRNFVASKSLPPPTHLSYEGVFNQIQFDVGQRTNELISLHMGYARYQFEKSHYDSSVHDYLAIFLKSSRDGADRDETVLNATICLDISGSMGGGLAQPKKPKNFVKEQQKKVMSRLELSIEAIKMFWSKLRPDDSFGMVIFDNKAELVVKQTRKSEMEQKPFFDLLNKLKPRGGTTIALGFDLAHNTLSTYLQTETYGKLPTENRLIMITDVGDNSIAGTNQFIRKASEASIHMSIIGVSSSFRSQTCQSLKNIKGFNYFCAIDENDIMKYVFETFAFGFFPVAHDLQLTIESKNIKKFEVYGSTDADQVEKYNHGFPQQSHSFVISRMKSIFPSEIVIREDHVFTIGGLVLLKISSKQPQPEFDALVKLKYSNIQGKEKIEQFPINFKVPLNQQFMSEAALSQAIQGYVFTSEMKQILQDAKGKTKKNELIKYKDPLEDLLQICPKEKKEDVQNMLKIINESPSE